MISAISSDLFLLVVTGMSVMSTLGWGNGSCSRVAARDFLIRLFEKFGCSPASRARRNIVGKGRFTRFTYCHTGPRWELKPAALLGGVRL